MAVSDSKSEIEKKRSSTAILICFDDKFAPAAGVMLTSLFLNNRHINFDLYAIAKCDISSNLDSIKLLCKAYRRKIKFIDIDKKLYSFFRITDHFSHAAYFRIFAPDLIDAQKILYLDVDIIVQADISPLLDLDIGSHLIAGALDNNPTKGFRERLGLSPNDPYINTGVLLINADLWRKENITATLVDYYTRHKDSLKWADQDLINACLSGRVSLLDQHWNFLYGDIIFRKILLPGFDPKLFRGIFHYNTPEKPWFRWAREPFRSLYRIYAAKSPIRMAEIKAHPHLNFKLNYKAPQKIGGKLDRLTIREYAKKILRTKPIVCGKDAEFELHTLTCQKDLHMTLWSLKTFFHYSEFRPRLVIYSDGSLNKAGTGILLNHFLNCQIIRRDRFHRDMENFLKAHRSSLEHSKIKSFCFALKLFGPMYYTKSERVLYLDSDVLFFQKPNEILKCIKSGTPFYNSDYQNAYSFPVEFLNNLLNIDLAHKINTGLYHFTRKDFVDNMDLLESYFIKVPIFKSHGWDEQTMTAILLSKANAVRLNSDYQISKEPITDNTISHHFVNDGSRPDFFTKGLKRLVSSGFIKDFECRTLSAGTRIFSGQGL